MTKALLAALIGFSSASLLSAAAHHASDPHFDRSQEVTITGNVAELKLVNPHAYLHIDVEQDGGTINWRCELSAATYLKRRGWTEDMFTIGQEITVKGAPAWHEDNVCLFISAELDDGRSIDRNATLIETAKLDAAEVD